MSLTARELEQAGIATVVVGSARDIVEECGIPRFVFSDVPLGNPFGPPDEVEAQKATLKLSLEVIEQALWPRTTIQAPLMWTGNEWRDNYMRIDDSNRAALAAAGDARRDRQAATRRSRTPPPTPTPAE